MDNNQELIQLLREIRDNTAAIRYHLTGEKPHITRIAGYIRGENMGGSFVWLYSDHPSLENKIVTVYADNPLFERLPLGAVENAPVCEDKQAPNRDEATGPSHSQYYIPVEPFSVSTVRREADNAFGYKIVLTGVSMETGAQAGNGHEPATVSAQPEPDEIIRNGELDPARLKMWIQQEAAKIVKLHRGPTPAQTGAVHRSLEAVIQDEPTRRAFQEWLTGHNSMADMSPEQILALHQWLKPSGTNGPTDPHARDEIATALDALRPVASAQAPNGAVHPTWAGSADAIAWGVQMGAYGPDLAVTKAAFWQLYDEWDQPGMEAMFQKWDTHVRGLVQAANVDSVMASTLAGTPF